MKFSDVTNIKVRFKSDYGKSLEIADMKLSRFSEISMFWQIIENEETAKYYDELIEWLSTIRKTI